MSIKLEDLWKKSFSIQEQNFLAENSLIEVVPSMKTTVQGKITLISVNN